MIDKIGRGWDAKGLVRYLMGKGRSNEHTAPTVIAAWQNDPGALQPTRSGEGDFDFDPDSYNQLLEHVNAPAEAAELPRRQPEKGAPGYTKHGYVWHCSLSLGAEDGELTFEQWGEIARDVMDRTGIAPEGDAGGCRWIAVHHGKSKEGNDHIHIAAVLVRQDTGRRFHPRDDFGKTRTAMRHWEDRLGLRVTAINDGTAAPAATRGESEKAQRRQLSGYEGLARGEAGAPARVQLRQVVVETAAVSGDGEEFLAGLREQGVLVHLHHDKDGAVDGYAVADPQDRDERTGRPVFFGGRTLAPELSWPKLQRGWDGVAPADSSSAAVGRKPHQVLDDVAATTRAAAVAVRDRTEAPEHIARSVQPLLSAWARIAEGAQVRGDLTRAAWDYDRAARTPRHLEVTRAGEAARALRGASQQLSSLRMISGRGQQRDSGLALALAVSSLLLELAAWHEQNKRLHHAVASRATDQSIGRFGAATATAAAGRRGGTAGTDRGPSSERAAAPARPAASGRPSAQQPTRPRQIPPPQQGPTRRV